MELTHCGSPLDDNGRCQHRPHHKVTDDPYPWVRPHDGQRYTERARPDDAVFSPRSGLADIGLIEAVRSAQSWCPLCGGSGMVMEFSPTDCPNLAVHRELSALALHLERAN